MKSSLNIPLHLNVVFAVAVWHSVGLWLCFVCATLYEHVNSAHFHVVTPSPIGEQSIVMSNLSMSVCVCVFVCPRSYLGTILPIFTNFFVLVTYGRGSVLLWRRSDTLCTSGFMDDVIFEHKPRSQRRRPAEVHCTCSLGLGYKLCTVIPVAGQRTHGTTSPLKVTSQSQMATPGETMTALFDMFWLITFYCHSNSCHVAAILSADCDWKRHWSWTSKKYYTSLLLLVLSLFTHEYWLLFIFFLFLIFFCQPC